MPFAQSGAADVRGLCLGPLGSRIPSHLFSCGVATILRTQGFGAGLTAVLLRRRRTLRHLHHDQFRAVLVPVSPLTILRKHRAGLALVRGRAPPLDLIGFCTLAHLAIVSTSENQPKPVQPAHSRSHERRHRKASAADARHTRASTNEGALGIRVEMGWSQSHRHHRHQTTGTQNRCINLASDATCLLADAGHGEAAGTERCPAASQGRCPSCASRQVAARSGISGVVPGAKNRAPTASTTNTYAELFRAADQCRRSFPGDDRPQHEAEDHRGTGSDRDTGHRVSEENTDCDTEDRCGHDRQSDIGRRRPRTRDRTSPSATVDDVLAEIITRRLTKKSDPRCSMGREPITRRSGHVWALCKQELR